MATNETIARQLDKLRGVLLQSGIQQTNQPLFQVINQLIGIIKATNIATSEATGGSSGLAGQHYLTHENDLALLPNSRELLAGANVTFDDSVVGERTVAVALDQTILTVNDETATLPNSVQELAGDHIDFDDSVANQRTVSGPEWSVLTNGDAENPEPMYDSNGDVIMTVSF